MRMGMRHRGVACQGGPKRVKKISKTPFYFPLLFSHDFVATSALGLFC
jgi:hypothetical protein